MNGTLFRILLMALIYTISGPVSAQQNPAPVEEPIKGGVSYDPIRGEENTLRDPFKSPFELEQEQEEEGKDELGLGDEEERLPFDIAELGLKGIYFTAQSGYWAIFTVGDEYKWWQVGVKFLDGDLINITDGAVVFNHFVTDGGNQVREVIKELRRGEE
jgi:Tfp pilus assembly protein PilP